MRQKGFSIIEIAVTLVVLGMVLATAVPSISDWVRNARIRNEANALVSGLQVARETALRRNRPVSFYLVNQPTGTTLTNACTVSATGTSWVVSINSPHNACGNAPATTSSSATNPLIVNSHFGAEATTGLSVSAIDNAQPSAAASAATFDALGRLTSGAAHITVAYSSSRTGDRPLRIDITRTGNVRACDPSITDGTDPRRCLCDPSVPPTASNYSTARCN